jgi:hypothetical protein
MPSLEWQWGEVCRTALLGPRSVAYLGPWGLKAHQRRGAGHRGTLPLSWYCLMSAVFIQLALAYLSITLALYASHVKDIASVVPSGSRVEVTDTTQRMYRMQHVTGNDFSVSRQPLQLCMVDRYHLVVQDMWHFSSEPFFSSSVKDRVAPVCADISPLSLPSSPSKIVTVFVNISFISFPMAAAVVTCALLLSYSVVVPNVFAFVLVITGCCYSCCCRCQSRSPHLDCSDTVGLWIYVVVVGIGMTLARSQCFRLTTGFCILPRLVFSFSCDIQHPAAGHAGPDLFKSSVKCWG